MTKVLILGAHGQIARVATSLFLEHGDVELSLYLRDARRLQSLANEPRVRIIEGDVLELEQLRKAMAGQDVVYANLAGHLERQAQNIVRAMHDADVKRLIFVSSMGIYDEVPGHHSGAVLNPYRSAAKIIEASDLDYTIIRPAWLNDHDEVRYGTTEKGQPFQNGDETVSRKSVADLIVKLATTPALAVRGSLGVHGLG